MVRIFQALRALFVLLWPAERSATSSRQSYQDSVGHSQGVIPLDDPRALTAWALKLNVTETDLRGAMKIVGSSESAVRSYFGRTAEKPAAQD